MTKPLSPKPIVLKSAPVKITLDSPADHRFNSQATAGGALDGKCSSDRPVLTPCIGICSTGIGDDVCRGCKRFAHEVIDWNAYSCQQRQIIARRLDSFLTLVVKNKVIVDDASLLETQLRRQQIRFNDQQSPYCWVFELLIAGAGQVSNLLDYGVRCLPQWRHRSLTELKKAIDNDFYTLSSAYYERYWPKAPYEEKTPYEEEF